MQTKPSSSNDCKSEESRQSTNTTTTTTTTTISKRKESKRSIVKPSVKNKGVQYSKSVKCREQMANFYVINSSLSGGSFSTVKIATYMITGQKVAMKIIEKQKLDKVAIDHLSSEINCFRLVKHPNIIDLYDLYESPNHLYLIMELGDCDLYQHIIDNYSESSPQSNFRGGVPDRLANYYFRQIVSAISYCHSLRIVHRDLKPQNIILFRSSNVLKLADFGFSRIVDTNENLSTACGSIPYTAPEILLNDTYDGRAADIWSLGVILFMLVTGNVPFNHVNQSEMLTMIMDCYYVVPEHVSEYAGKLLQNCLVVSPRDRYTIEEIAQSKWLQSYISEDNCEQAHKVIEISTYLHNLVMREIVDKNKMFTVQEIKETLLENRCNSISAAYFLIATCIFRKAVGYDTINFTLILPKDLAELDFVNGVTLEVNSPVNSTSHTENNSLNGSRKASLNDQSSVPTINIVDETNITIKNTTTTTTNTNTNTKKKNMSKKQRKMMSFSKYKSSILNEISRSMEDVSKIKDAFMIDSGDFNMMTHSSNMELRVSPAAENDKILVNDTEDLRLSCVSGNSTESLKRTKSALTFKSIQKQFTSNELVCGEDTSVNGKACSRAQARSHEDTSMSSSNTGTSYFSGGGIFNSRKYRQVKKKPQPMFIEEEEDSDNFLSSHNMKNSELMRSETLERRKNISAFNRLFTKRDHHPAKTNQLLMRDTTPKRGSLKKRTDHQQAEQQNDQQTKQTDDNAEECADGTAPDSLDQQNEEVFDGPNMAGQQGGGTAIILKSGKKEKLANSDGDVHSEKYSKEASSTSFKGEKVFKKTKSLFYVSKKELRHILKTENESTS